MSNPKRLYEILEELPSLSTRPVDALRSIELSREALTLVSRADNPMLWADLQTELGCRLSQSILGEQERCVEESIDCYNRALTVCTEAEHPVKWAALQQYLGLSYAGRVRGVRADNLQRAISCFESALKVYSSGFFQDLEKDTRLYIDHCLNEKRLLGESTTQVSSRHDYSPMLGTRLPSVSSRRAKGEPQEPMKLRIPTILQKAQPFEDLDSAQSKAVRHRGTNLLIIAGAGSGKTRTLTYRVASLLHDIPPENMMVVTFTNKAADEIRKRIQNYVSVDVKRLWMGTFHSICRRILLQDGAAIGLAPNWNILDASDSQRIMQIGGAPLRAKPEDVLRLYNYARNSMQDWRELVGSPRFSDVEDFEAAGRLIRLYSQRCRRNSRVDFDDLLCLVEQLFTKRPDIRDKYRARFKAILVDEYQDTSRVQGRILELLASNDNITVVGDDAQAIYGFRAATVENILEFAERFKPTTVIKLETNYRSTPQIIALSNDSIRHNKRQAPKTMRAIKPAGPLPEVVSAASPEQEATFIVDRVLEFARRGVGLDDIAVLARARRQVAELELQLSQADIPYKVVGGTDFFGLEHVKVVIDFARLLINAEDTIALSAVCQLSSFTTMAALEAAERLSEESSRTLWDAAVTLAEQNRPGQSQAYNALLDFGRHLDEFKISVEDKPSHEVLVAIIEHELGSHLKKKHGPRWNEIAEDLTVLINIASHYSSLRDMVDQIALDRFEESNVPQNSNHPIYGQEVLTLSTVHSAKGLEWHTVFVVGLVEFWFPLNYAIQAEGNAEEERRLFYVAVTRAERELYLLHYEQSLDYYGRLHDQTQSRFLRELSSATYKSTIVTSNRDRVS